MRATNIVLVARIDKQLVKWKYFLISNTDFAFFLMLILHFFLILIPWNCFLSVFSFCALSHGTFYWLYWANDSDYYLFERSETDLMTRFDLLLENSKVN
jgi:hypothetical protein